MTPPRFSGDQASLEAVADALVNLLPDSQRAEARRLIEPILRRRLAGLATHSRPERLAEVVYERLAGVIEEAGANSALDRLRDEALISEVDGLLQDALALAVARYGADHADAAQLSRAWAGHHPDWLERDAAFYAAEAEQLQQERERLELRLGSIDPGLAGSLRPELLRADLNLRSARSGSFATASGSLSDFLRDAGAEFQYLDFE